MYSINTKNLLLTSNVTYVVGRFDLNSPSYRNYYKII